MITRRRFLTITCAALGAPAMAAGSTRWHGRALGAEVSIAINGPDEVAKPALIAALEKIRRVEALFSLYDPGSLLVQLNQTGSLDAPPPDFLHLFQASDAIHSATGGRFDPTVQVLWQAAATGQPLDAARPQVGWHRIRFDAEAIRLAPGQQLTFNGIAQGYATDLVTDALRRAGLQDIHVNIGEQAAYGIVRRLGLSDPDHGVVGTLSLKDGAVATSSPAATPLGRIGHIFAPDGTLPQWSTVSVMAQRATLADALSTALCLAPQEMLERTRELPGVRRIVVIHTAGDVLSF